MVLKGMNSFVAGRKMTLNGITYQPGDAVPNAVLKPIKHLSCMISKRFLIPNQDPHQRTTDASTPTPTDSTSKRQGAL